MAMAMAGCSHVADFDDIGVGRGETADGSGVIRPSDIVDHIKCELWQEADAEADHDLDNYLVSVLLNLKVDDNGGLSPSVSYINPVAAMNQPNSLTATLSGQLSRTRERTYSEAFILDMSKITKDGCVTNAKPGFELNPGINFMGDLGIHGVVEFGLKSIPKADNGQVYADSFGGGTSYADIPMTIDGTQLPSFGSSLQFTLTKSLSGGPSWTFEHWKIGAGGGASGGGSGGGGSSSGGSSGGSGGSGGGGSGGLINFGRLDTHQLWISFVPQKGHELKKETVESIKTFRARSEMLQAQIANAKTAPEFALTGPPLQQQLKDNDTSLKAALDNARNERRRTDSPDGDVAKAARGIVNTMILQNLEINGPSL